MDIDEDIGDSSTPEAPATKMSRQQILTLIAMASINFSSMICYSILGPFFPNEAKKKGVSQAMIGLIFGIYALCTLVGSLILGKYIVQIGAKFMIVAGLFVSSGCTVLFGFLDQVSDGTVFIVLCFITRCINAIGFSAAVTSSFAVSGKVFPDNIATVLGFMEIFTGLGLILGPPLGGWLYQSFGYEIPFVFTGCLLFATVPLNLWILPSFDAVPSSQNSFLRLCTRIKILLICFVVFTLSSGLGFLDATLSIFAIEKLNLSAGSVGLLMIGLSLPYGAASPIFGVISDKYPSIRKWMMVVGGMATAVSFCFLGPLPVFHIRSQLWLTVLMLIVVGFSLCMSCIPTFAEMIACAHENGFEEGMSTLGLVSGLFSAVWSAGMFFGPTIGGYITQALNFEWSAGVQGALAFLAALLQVIYFTIEDIQKKSQKASRTDVSSSQGEKSPLLPKTDHLRVDIS
ncbi:MFS-type transporter SLC18B1-like [Sinocyclocheilus anshuiensis]|uniref:MFS-type transporter SLC18B1-like n=2 Tax=Sinocyclocheilus TaxID=75365 RepID=A0A671SJE1_9TELE|nr:PREDICTED: MFS-type transporter SLC18B1-like [Sinocyclocheilus anshuiensis]XP_016411274.1 PREDICTED: MFS-type transporter SLC18B1-like [Sinocyclocheilus rhinocerous]